MRIQHSIPAAQTSRRRRLLKLVRPSIRSDSERIVRWMAGRQLPRRILNAVYNRFSYLQKSSFHARFAKLFRGSETRPLPGMWTVYFHGRRVSVPLRPETMWLDWDSALSVLGHEQEIKATYETLIGQSENLRCVFDVGANYGLHSLLFLVHGVRVVSFEPNTACHGYMRALEALNDVRFCVEPVAFGSSEGTVELCYPETDTWLGTTDPEHSREILSKYRSQRIEVPGMTIDGYVRRSERIPDLIKLDTEGNELAILLGARQTMETARPLLIFECWRNNKRRELWDTLDSLGYSVVGLPLLSLERAAPVASSAFMDSEASNFAALPRERLDIWSRSVSSGRCPVST